MRSFLLAWTLISVHGSEEERKLHRALFDPDNYNPRVIQDNWRKANRGDYDNIGSFAADKCAGYNPPNETIGITPGSLLVTDSFATMRPYNNNMDMEQRFYCPSGATIQLRLDLDRGFDTESSWDYLEVDYNGYYRKLSGSIGSLPNELKQKNWFDTESDYLRVRFVTDSSVTKSGFKFDILCAEKSDGKGKDENGEENADASLEESALTNTIITNQNTDGGQTGSFSKEVSCQLPSESIKYRLMRERINPAEAATFDEVVEKTVKLIYGINLMAQSLNATNNDWIDTHSRKFFVFFNVKTFDENDGSGNFSHPQANASYVSSSNVSSVEGLTLELPDDSSLSVTFFIEVKCEQVLMVSEAIELQAVVEIDDALLTQMKLLDTVDDVTKFWKYSNEETVKSQVGLIREFVLDGNCTGLSCLEGFVVKKGNSLTSLTSHLPKDMCEQYIYTQLTMELKNASKRDYTEIFEESEQFKKLWGLINPAQERSGYVYDPIEIDVYLQIKAINDINLSEEYMDASLVITIEWFDRQLSWKTGSQQATAPSTTPLTPTNNSMTSNNTNGPQDESNSKEETKTTSININSIRADKSQVWIPEIEILNRVNDFSPIDEKQRQLKIESSGKVIYSRAYRMRSMMSSSLNTYPYDVQFANIILSSVDYSSEKVKLTVHHWLNETKFATTSDTNGWHDESMSKKSLDAIKYKYYNGNTEWNFFAYKIEIGTLTDIVLGRNFSAVDVKFGFQRNSPYYTMTLIIPIITLTLLAPLGLIIPVEAGEKLGFQVTLLLTVVIYIDYLQNNIPVFDTIGTTPNLLIYFVAMILLITLSLLVTTHTLFLYHVNSYESRNFSKTEARISMYIAKFFTYITFKLWEVDVPPKVMEIIEHEGDEIHKTFQHDELSLGFKFMADMMNRMFFLIIVVAEIIAFLATILTAITAGSSNTIRLAVLMDLEEILVDPITPDSITA